jgi:hypothetical protein
MLAKDPAARYQTPIEVARALAPFAHREGGVPGKGSPLPAGIPSAGKGTVSGTDTSKLPEAPRGGSLANRPKGAVAAVQLVGGVSQGTGRPRTGPSVPAAGPGGGGRRGTSSRLLLAAGGASLAALAGIIIIIIITREDPRTTTPSGREVAAATARESKGPDPVPPASSTGASTERGGAAGPGIPAKAEHPVATAKVKQPVRVVTSGHKNGGGFTEGNDGWTTKNQDDTTDATTEIQRLVYEGFHYLSARDVNGEKEWGWHAPEKYHGDHSDLFGRLLMYSLWASRAGNGPATEWYVRLNGGGQTIFVDGSRLHAPVPGESTEYSVRLDTSGGWQRWSADGGILGPATDEDIKRVLANVTDLRLKGEFYTAGAEGHLHWVIFGADE